MDQETILRFGVKLIIIFLVIPIHEFAHAWSADKMGDNTARSFFYRLRLGKTGSGKRFEFQALP